MNTNKNVDDQITSLENQIQRIMSQTDILPEDWSYVDSLRYLLEGLKRTQMANRIEILWAEREAKIQ